jgi:A/G-specific adenine glycosylase
MLQQTQVATVRDYFTKWMKRFPDVKTLAAANEEEVFRYWQGLGYYSRAKNILKAARTVCEGKAAAKKLPDSRKELEALPGIGAYTAGAILSLAYHQREAILDGNLVRIFSRFYALDFLPTDKTSQKKSPAEVYWDYARSVADSPKAYMHNEALMELGRTVCKIRNPECSYCPLRDGCQAFRENRVAEFPPAKKHLQKDWYGTVLVVESSDHKVLAVHGGQKFFKNQFALPHFESARNAPVGFAPEMEKYMNPDSITSVQKCGSFKHGITVHKMECRVLHVLLSTKAPKRTVQDIQWVALEKAKEFFANSFSLKALEHVLSA